MSTNVHRSTIEYRYWNDPNELCEHLKLLISSKPAGHTGLDVVSILEELVEAGIIQDFDNIQL